MRTRLVFLLFVSVWPAAWLEGGQVDAPRVGVARYSDNSVHTVFGLPGDFVISNQVIGSADAVSFSDSGGLLAKNGRIQLIEPSAAVIAEYESGESAPLLNVDGDLRSAIAWLPARHSLLHWNGKSFVVTDVASALPGVVTSLCLENASTAQLLLAEKGGVVSEATISLETGYLISLNVLPGIAGPAFRQHSFVLFHDERGLEIVSGSSAPHALPLSATDLIFERMSSDWLHLASASSKQNWILHLSKTALELSELPALPARALASPGTIAQEIQK